MKPFTDPPKKRVLREYTTLPETNINCPPENRPPRPILGSRIVFQPSIFRGENVMCYQPEGPLVPTWRARLMIFIALVWQNQPLVKATALCGHITIRERNQLMVNCWFGLVWIPGIPLWKGLLYTWVYPDSNSKPPPTQTNNQPIVVCFHSLRFLVYSHSFVFCITQES